MLDFTVRASDFRVLPTFEWSPSGVCLLTGANGAGKTTALNVLKLLGALFRRGHESALSAIGGGVAFRRWESPDESPVEFEVRVGRVRWKLRFPMSDVGLKGTYGEELHRDGDVVLRAGMFQDWWSLGTERMPIDGARCCARVLWDRGDAEWMRPLVELVESVRVYESYWLNRVKRPEAVAPTHSFLHQTGSNLWSVLSNWKSAPLRHGDRFEWVQRQARRAFPDIMGSIEFDRGVPYLFRPGAHDPAAGLLPDRAADGLLTGLLHLTAVAGAPDGGIVAFDEVENHLHPHAIRSLIDAMRQQAEARGLTVVVTTHSPVVLNEFKDHEDRVFVVDPTAEVTPRALDEVHDPAWLSHFALGDLYEREQFAAPRRGQS